MTRSNGTSMARRSVEAGGQPAEPVRQSIARCSTARAIPAIVTASCSSSPGSQRDAGAAGRRQSVASRPGAVGVRGGSPPGGLPRLAEQTPVIEVDRRIMRSRRRRCPPAAIATHQRKHLPTPNSVVHGLLTSCGPGADRCPRAPSACHLNQPRRTLRGLCRTRRWLACQRGARSSEKARAESNWLSLVQHYDGHLSIATINATTASKTALN